MTITSRFAILVLALALVGPTAHAQGWRGMGHVSGKVVDQQGQPLEGVDVKLDLPGTGGMQVKTNKKGEWSAGGLARGSWHVDFEKAGYDTARITVSVEELSRIAPIETTLKKSAPDPNEVIRGQLVTAAGLMDQKKFAEARAIYEDILAKYPTATEVQPLIARTYYGDKQFDKAIEHMKIAVQDNPTVENKLLLGNLLIEQGRAEEAHQVLATVDESAVKDPLVFVNVGIGLMNQNKPDEALTYFEKAIARFPQSGDAYYYRGLIRLRKGDTEGTKADFTKFLELAPNAPEAAAARKALEQIK